MPNSRDAAKRYRQNIKRRDSNRKIRSRVRTSIKTFEAAVARKDRADAEVKYAEFIKLIDTASRKGIFHRNMAARKKSRLHKGLLTCTERSE